MRWTAKIAALMMVLGLPTGAAFAETPKSARLDVHVEGPHLKSFAGSKSNYAFFVANSGDAPATHVVLRYVVPRTFKVVSASDGGQEDQAARTITWKWDDLQPGTTRSVVVQLEALHSYPWRHACSVTADGGLQAAADFGSSQPVVDPLLLVVVDANDPITVGTTTTYEMRLTNISLEAFTNVSIQATIPPGMKVNQITSPISFTQVGRDVTFKPIGTLAPCKGVFIRIDCKATAEEQGHFNATVSADEIPEER